MSNLKYVLIAPGAPVTLALRRTIWLILPEGDASVSGAASGILFRQTPEARGICSLRGKRKGPPACGPRLFVFGLAPVARAGPLPCSAGYPAYFAGFNAILSVVCLIRAVIYLIPAVIYLILAVIYLILVVIYLIPMVICLILMVICIVPAVFWQSRRSSS